MNRSRKIFIVYMIVLFNLVTIKFNGSILALSQRVYEAYQERISGALFYNFTPFSVSTRRYFREFSTSLADLLDTKSPAYIMEHIIPDVVLHYAFFNIFGNIILFVPLGFLIPLNFNFLKNKIITTILLSSAIIILNELIQYIFYLGVADIDDFILNIFGCFIGYILYFITNRYKECSIIKNN